MKNDPDEWGARAALPLLEIADDLAKQFMQPCLPLLIALGA
jgi:hypothetical protein